MHESRPLDDIIEVNEKMGTNPPDRQRFENDLEEFHVEMQKIRSQIQMRCKKCTDSNPIENEMRTQREQLRVELAELKRGGDKIKLDIDAQASFRTNRMQKKSVSSEYSSIYTK
ncbi:hypothetical protein B9Z55_026151 [Caenorhabditis nigoni]|uniref:Uncharacterized protein n=1 Tax=Caenorhabditis nigoni TaxID=1611254 RepID=A0A2G5T1T7_9PELO|nr:hypothetical protein B9Z55_026151 [Caenorhabditis nigoni]